MKIKHPIPLMALIALGVAFAAQAHDPKEHMKDAAKPDCAPMKDMDHSKMDMNDPVVQAMMKKCMNDKHHDGGSHEAPEADHQHHQEHSDKQHPEYQH